MDGHNRVAAVIFPGKQALGFQPVDQIPQPVNFASQVGFDVFAFAAQIEVRGDIVARRTRSVSVAKTFSRRFF